MSDVRQPAASTPAQRRTALVLLLGVCVAWGSTFPLMKQSFALIDVYVGEGAKTTTPILFITWRMIIASALLFPVLALHPARPLRRISRGAWRDGGILGLLFIVSFYFQVFGLRHTTPSVSAFVTSLYVVFTPLVVWVLLRKVPPKRVGMAALIAFLGVALIADVSGESTLKTFLSPGVAWSFLCAVGFAAHITLTDITTRREDPLLLSLLMLVLAALGGVIGLYAFVPDIQRLLDVSALILMDWEIMWRLLVMVITATVFAVVAWNHYQKYLGPSRAAVLYTLEPVFGAVFSISMGLEGLTPFLLIGGVLIVGANLICELPVFQKKRPSADMTLEARSVNLGEEV